MIPEALAGLRVHIPPDRAGVHSIHCGAIGELPGPRPCHALERGFGAAVDGLSREAHARGYAGDVDDAAGAVGREVGETGLGEEDGR